MKHVAQIDECMYAIRTLRIKSIRFYPPNSGTLYRYRRILAEAYRYDCDTITVIERGDDEAWRRGNYKRYAYKPEPREVLIIMAGAGRWGAPADVRIGSEVTLRDGVQ